MSSSGFSLHLKYPTYELVSEHFLKQCTNNRILENYRSELKAQVSKTRVQRDYVFYVHKLAGCCWQWLRLHRFNGLFSNWLCESVMNMVWTVSVLCKLEAVNKAFDVVTMRLIQDRLAC